MRDVRLVDAGAITYSAPSYTLCAMENWFAAGKRRRTKIKGETAYEVTDVIDITDRAWASQCAPVAWLSLSRPIRHEWAVYFPASHLRLSRRITTGFSFEKTGIFQTGLQTQIYKETVRLIAPLVSCSHVIPYLLRGLR